MSSHPGFPGSSLFFDGLPDAVVVHQLLINGGVVSIDQWHSPSLFSVGAGKGDFPPFIIEQVLKPMHAKGRILAWVADFSGARNGAVYQQDTLDKIHHVVFPAFAKYVKHFIVVYPVTTLKSMLWKQVDGFRTGLEKVGITPHFANSPEEAMAIIRGLK